MARKRKARKSRKLSRKNPVAKARKARRKSRKNPIAKKRKTRRKSRKNPVAKKRKTRRRKTRSNPCGCGMANCDCAAAPVAMKRKRKKARKARKASRKSRKNPAKAVGLCKGRGCKTKIKRKKGPGRPRKYCRPCAK